MVDLIASMGGNTVRVYMLMAPSFYEALAAHNEDAAEPLYLLQGIYLDDYAAYSHMDGFDDGYMGTLRGLIGQRRRWHTGLYESMRKHEHIFANHRYSLVGSISYGYFLIYELWSPVIELAGILTVLIACAFNFINVPLTILFHLIYAIFGAVMSLTAFFSRVQTRDLKLTASDIVRAIMLSLIEVTVLRFILAVTRMLALVGYRKSGRRWERVERTHLDAS
ncbi:hypothetical protein H6A16_00860 [Collinsella tanakaei]|uniref:hypothetical protein n=1 Tax=Collinsella tanakaei TaxID=626935 RepID=UPI0019592F6E|nr:hypothetical protein [Collinsella tanakaei]MBM6778055.1 hypothetical protein [Collinsella tanakaei]